MPIPSKLYTLDHNHSPSGPKILPSHLPCDRPKEDFDPTEYYKNDPVVLPEVITADTPTDKSRKVVKNSKTNEAVAVGGALVNNGSCNLPCEYVGKHGRNTHTLKPSPIMDNVVTTVTIGHHKHSDNDPRITDKFVHLWAITQHQKIAPNTLAEGKPPSKETNDPPRREGSISAIVESRMVGSAVVVTIVAVGSL